MSTLIIAEAGVNHNGSLELAKKMALVAKECGADVVKYQTAVPEMVISKFAKKAEYQKQTTGDAESQLEMVRKLHFDFAGHKELKEYCDSIGIQYLSAPFDIPSVHFLGTLGLPYIKVPSGEITNLPYLEEVGRLKIPVILSTGMGAGDLCFQLLLNGIEAVHISRGEVILDLDGLAGVDELLQADLIGLGEVSVLALLQQRFDLGIQRIQCLNVGGQLIGDGGITRILRIRAHLFQFRARGFRQRLEGVRPF